MTQYTERRVVTHAPLLNESLRGELIDAGVIRPQPIQSAETSAFHNIAQAPVLRLRATPTAPARPKP